MRVSGTERVACTVLLASGPELGQGVWSSKKQGRRVPGGSRPADRPALGEITGLSPWLLAGNPFYPGAGGGGCGGRKVLPTQLWKSCQRSPQTSS